ncbi:major facilitator family transporter [Corynebacterium glutamicum MT]|uniref:MFS transporter n=1 Tax=Corynebacterium glutamicum TaxID=1718 RepID=A0AB36I929_CORGT|nr:MFS transporter [Corynebacterium glutamicum]AGN18817.1 major facilitator family transporter [Corynebacterium glutamicum SCgG1]AGN21840.1 major facilitator family transporter [Corynebacterium glutamicum SCgG2]EGV39207.1 major facilitator family transporter [Corynebacterium glutamicum S9114]EOA65050.1 major facilitator family transporter [Corynebacterium glutamicum MT]EPP41169.1 major facilitator family transporter [Corynebacterium glutamicum Z188]
MSTTKTIPQKKFWNYENKLVTVFFFAVGLVFFDRLVINFLMPYIQEDLGLSNAQVGQLAGAAAVTWAISSVIGGRISDKVRSKKSFLVILMVIFSVASAMQGLVGTFIHLVVLRLLMGMFEGPSIPVTQSVLAIESSPHRRGFNLGFTMNTANGLFGSVLAPIVIVALANIFNWRTAFFFTVIPGLIMAFVIWKVMREPDVSRSEFTESREEGALKEVVKNRNVLLSTVMFSGFMVYLIALQVFGPLFLTNIREYSTSSMSLIMSAFGIGTAIWGFVVPLISDKLGRKPTAVVFGLLSAFAPLSFLWFENPIILAIAVFFFAAGMGVGGMAMSVIPAESVRPALAGLAVGIPVGIGELIGGFLNPMITGAVADMYGLSSALFISSGGALVATFFALFLKETSPAKS